MQELPPHSFTVFVPLVDFTLENGPTEFIPGGATPLTAATQLMPTGSNVYRRKVDGTDVQAEPMSPLPCRGRLLYGVHARDATANCHVQAISHCSTFELCTADAPTVQRMSVQLFTLLLPSHGG